MHSTLVHSPPSGVSEHFLATFNATLMKEVSGVLARDMIAQSALIVKRFLAEFALESPLGVNSFHVAKVRIFILQTFPANFARKAALAVTRHVALERRRFQPVTANFALYPLDIVAVNLLEVNVQSGDNFRADVAH